ncbi:ROK family transcriptional regulator [Planctomicrobium piriforme]|uniref:N-acetylglucosamine repressor n=1 Tax=Planctomicrobium piriforme TaxID=1576369 RepID=A0A1I3E255_9PLAN|nr:ROK family protein [Planctomicrobium piriforme]SFH93056.1 N-acetylglucosamine repressor [Planctomicrobium piriforme]
MSARIEPTLLRRINERRVLELIQQRGPSSRAMVTRLSGLSAPTVSKAVTSLMEVGLLEEIEASAGAFGRPAKLVKLAADKVCVLGVVIDVNRSWVVATGLDGRLDPDRMRTFETPDTYESLLRKVETEAQILKRILGSEIQGVGISVPGLKNQRIGEVVLSPNLRVLDGHRPGKDLSDRLGVECVVLQESHALCLGERMFGEARGRDDFAMLDVSSGLGLGVMSGGRLLTGNSGLAGELGHITVDLNGLRCGCGNRGCLETLATDTALARAISEKIGRTVDIHAAVSLIRSGEIDATAELDRVVEYLAVGIAAVINIFNPTVLFVHGLLFTAADDLFSRVIERTRQRALTPALAECRIVQARGSKRQGAIAGILQHLTQSWAPTLS